MVDVPTMRAAEMLPMARVGVDRSAGRTGLRAVGGWDFSQATAVPAKLVAQVAKTPDSEGRLWCEQLGLFLAKVRGTLYAVDAEWLRWIGDGKPLPMPIERANAEAERANAQAERAERLAAELAALKGKSGSS